MSNLLTFKSVLPVSGYEVEVIEGDGLAEKLLMSKMDDPGGAIFGYWALLTEKLCGKKPTPEDIKDLTEPDQNSLSIEIYKASYGDILDITGFCPSCNQTTNYKIDLNKLEFKPLPDGAVQPDPTFTLMLSRSQKKVVWGYTTGKQALEDVGSKAFDPIRVDFKAIRTIDGVAPSYEDVLHLPLRDHRELRRDMNDKRCGYNPVIKRKCDHCDAIITSNLISDPSLLMPGLQMLMG